MRFTLNFTLTSILGALGNSRSERFVSLRPRTEDQEGELTVEECLAGIERSAAKIVLVEGDEPLEYKHIGVLVRELRARRKSVVVSTDGTQIRRFLHVIKPDSHFVWNVVFAGEDSAEDEKGPGSREIELALDGIQSAKRAGFLVAAQVVISENTAVEDTVKLFERLRKMHVDRFFVSSIEPGGKKLAEARKALRARHIRVFLALREGNSRAKFERCVDKGTEAQLISDGNS